jgi:diguanylate cyclase (GGDEF)-like protein
MDLITFIVVMALLPVLMAGIFAGGILYGRRGIKSAVNVAHIDKLTGLPDRALIESVLDQTTTQGLHVTVAVCDVNGLHQVNEELGHMAGDDLLMKISHRLMELLPASHDGIVARSGGDEFWIVTPASPNELLTAYTSNINGLAHSASVGIASTPQNGNPRRAMECADVAMYVAKMHHVPAEIYESSMGSPGGKGEDAPSRIRHRRHDDLKPIAPEQRWPPEPVEWASE